MRALIYSGAGSVDVVSLGQAPDPVPAEGQIRVRVEAAGLNRADILQRRGSYPAPPGWPSDIPGLEYAGVVESLGPGVSRWRIGDRVIGLVGGGAHAELLVTHEDEALPAPVNLTLIDAAAIPEAFLTAYDALHARGRLLRGECVLIHAAASGLGTAAVQLAKVLGATVLGTTRSAAKLVALRKLGLDIGIDTSGGSFREQVTMPVHLILDVLGGPAFQDNLAVLAPRGRLVMLGFLQGPMAPQANLDMILRKRLEVIGTVMRSRGAEERSSLVAEFRNRALPLFGPHVPTELPMHSLSHPARIGALLHPIVHAAFPMAKFADAHRAMEGDQNIGKLVLTWGSV
jgi:putative PIG3 family NAD(P)H quinone oxidoreductase